MAISALSQELYQLKNEGVSQKLSKNSGFNHVSAVLNVHVLGCYFQTPHSFAWARAITTTLNILEFIKYIKSSLLISKISKTKVEMAVPLCSFLFLYKELKTEPLWA